MKTAVLFRLGGLGDILILTPVAKELKKRGYEVDAVIGSPTGDVKKILEGTNLFRDIVIYSRFPQTGVDICEAGGGDWMSIGMKKEGYDLVVDYKFSVELNSHHKHMASGPGKEWFLSQSSNFVNWVDIMFAWAGIDPDTIAPEDKIPIYRMTSEEDAWAKKLLRNSNPDLLVSIQTNASSLVRTWYNPQLLPEAIKEEFHDKKVEFVVFDGSKWHHLKGKHDFPVMFPKGMDPIRASAALVGNSDIFVGADSGFSHIAEALGVKSLTIYTTVPAWTRMKYYKYSEAIEPVGNTFDGVQCRPCFVLDRYCPRVREKVADQLSPREKELKESVEQNIHPAIVAQKLKTTPQGVMMEAKVLNERLNALLEIQAPCSMTITPERIMAKLRTMV
jgi:ADP-heptose:LPS heptosyltransferase